MNRRTVRPTQRAFSVVELLVVVAVSGILIAILIPSLWMARQLGMRAHCQSNIRQLVAANTAYAVDHSHYVAAARNISGSNTQRWHGERKGSNLFDGEYGPLAPYLGGATGSRMIRRCLAFQPELVGFEASCGGYGYNQIGVGGQYYLDVETPAANGMPPHSILHPAQTVMFTDAAFLQRGKLIEYSFCEAPHFVDHGVEKGAASPSIHFRHLGRSNVAWCDGHVTSEKMAHSSASFAEKNIGWFGPLDNSPFDPL